MSLASRRILFGIFIQLLTFVVSGSAQHSSRMGTPAESKTGQSGVSTYARDKIETVNLANGNFSLSIPLATVGGRGSASYTIALSYNSKVWSTRLDREAVATEGPPGVPPPWGTPISHYSAMYDDTLNPSNAEPGLSNIGSGWTIRTAPGIKALTVGIDSAPTGLCNVRVEGIRDCGFLYALTKMWLTLPDGSQVELRDSITDGAPAPTTQINNGYHELIDRDRGRIWHSTDGSNVIFVRDANDTAVGGAGLFFPSGWVFLPDGTRMRMDGGAGSKIIDRNGNFITIDANGYTDELGRQTLFQIVNGVLTLTAKVYGGMPDRSISINTGVIGDFANLRADFHSLPRPFTTGDALHDQQNDYYEHTIAEPHTDLFMMSEGVKAYGLTEGADVGERTAVTQLNLIDGRSFRFRYNQYGEVAEIVYPGGGVSQVDYHGGPSSLCEGSAPIHLTLNRKVSERRVLTDGANAEATWVYSADSAWIDGAYRPAAIIEAHQGMATGPLLASEKHFFRMLNAEYRTCGSSITGTGNEKWENAKEFRTETQTGTGTTVTVREWQQRAPVVWGNDPGLNYSTYAQQRGQEQTTNDPRVTWEETTLENGKVKRVEYGYDDFNNVTSIKEYDFPVSGQPATLVRQTLRTYGSNINGNYGISNNGYCYSNLNPTDSTCGGGLATDVASIIYQRHLLLNETIKDGGDNQKAYSEFEYDNYTAAGNHAAIVSNSGMIHYDGSQFSAFASAYQPRGNPTKVTRGLSGQAIVSYSQYDNAGQVVWSKDPNGNISTVSYADNFGPGNNPDSGVVGTNGATYAMATHATNALGHQVKMQYDYSLGAASGVKDANGVITKTEYDSLGRPFRAIAALGLSEQSVSETSYPTNASNEGRVSKQLDATRWLSSKTSFDGFDRPVLAATAEDGLHYNSASYTIFSKTVYDALGRVKLVTNPYRTVAAATDGWSRNTYDLGGRLTEVATFAGGVSNQPPDSGTNSNWTGSVTTLYASEMTTVTDQTGRKRRSVVDGLGRLVRVDEPDQNNNLDAGEVPVQSTSYSYDTLDNLITVTQGSLPARIFAYNSLKRLISADNPESGTIIYQYDNNGNLKQKTDGRGVVSSYDYDELNRNVTVNYSDTASINPDITRIYDTGTNGIGRLRESYAGGSETAGTTVEHTKIEIYDALGRPREQRQRFKTASVWSAEYKTGRDYNIGGGVKSQTYPSQNHTVAYDYDDAGRLSGFTGNLGDGVSRNYATGIVYSAIGGMTKEQFGTDVPVFNKLAYNSRGQLAEIRVSTSYTGPTDANSNRGAILNQYSLCSGTGCDPENLNNGNLRRQDIFIPHNDQATISTSWYQKFDYDSLNRLKRVKEYNSSNTQLWQQEYDIDRYGNRKIHQNNTVGPTSGPLIPKPDFEVEPATNRLLALGDKDLLETQRVMRYDGAGNLKQDKDASGALVTRAYDAENRMTSETRADNSVAGSYTYNADGQRVRRKVNGVETWNIYGIDGELLAEYASNSNAASPQKEYGYRNGQLLITAEPGSGSVAPVFSDDYNDNSLDVNKWTVNNPQGTPTVTEQGQQLQLTLSPNTAGYNGVYSNTTYNLTGRMAQVELTQAVSSGGWAENLLELELDAQNYFLIDVGSSSIVFRARVNGINDQTVLSYDSSAHRHWRIRHDQGANTVNFETSADAVVWITRKTVTTPFALTSLRFYLMAGAWGTGNGSPGLAKYDNFKLLPSTAGSSTVTVPNAGFESPVVGYSGFQYSPTGGSWSYYIAGVTGNGSGFTGGTAAPEGNQAAFLQGGPGTYISQPVTGFQAGTNYIITFAAAQRSNCCNAGGQDIRVYLDTNLLGTFHPASGSYADYSTATFTTTAGQHTLKFEGLNPLGGDHTAFIDNVRVTGSPVPGNGIQWMISDQLGTPRMVIDQTGALANVKRHDYLPFGEELYADTGGRTTGQGYTTFGNLPADGARQKFTLKERDSETRLDYFLARYYSSTQGRFTSPDEFKGGPDELFVLGSGDNKRQALPYAEIAQPQSLNKYTYVYNNPCRYVDPDGHCGTPSGLKPGQVGICVASFIASRVVKSGGVPTPGLGDGRGPNGQGGTSRVEVRLIVDTDGKVTKTYDHVGTSAIGHPKIGFKGSGGSEISSPNKDEKGNIYFQVHQVGTSNTPAGYIGNIENHLNMVVTPDRKVGITPSSTAKDYPSLEVHKYTMDDKGNVTTTLIKHKPESNNVFHLMNKEKPIKADLQ